MRLPYRTFVGVIVLKLCNWLLFFFDRMIDNRLNPFFILKFNDLFSSSCITHQFLKVHNFVCGLMVLQSADFGHLSVNEFLKIICF